ncbi:MAG: RNA polymerase sigma-70 factor [Chloroflexota bacterium]
MQSTDFTQYRRLLFSIAYRMLGSATDAEDMVQEAFLRWQSASPDEVRSPKSYLSAVVTRLCIDHLRSAKVQRELYVGPWLPEPIMTQYGPDAQNSVEQAESLSMAFLLLLESLSPVERAVFLLHKVFDYSYAEIASIVGKSEANCRQMAKRAQQHLQEGRPRFPVSREQQEHTTRSFMQVCEGGDMQALLGLLTSDAVLLSDGGGKVLAARNPIFGAESVARFILGVLGKVQPGTNFTAELGNVNGQPAILTRVDGVVNAVVLLDLDGGKIRAVHLVVNPDKLTSIH